MSNAYLKTADKHLAAATDEHDQVLRENPDARYRDWSDYYQRQALAEAVLAVAYELRRANAGSSQVRRLETND